MDLANQSAGQKSNTATPGSGSIPTQGQQAAPPKPPRPIGSAPQEAKYLAQGVGQGIVDLIPDFLQEVLGIKNTDSPDSKAKKKQIFDNFQSLSADEQAYVQKKMQREQAEKQAQEQAVMERKQREAVEKENSVVVPTGRVTGEAAAGASKSDQATQKLQSDRKKMTNSG